MFQKIFKILIISVIFVIISILGYIAGGSTKYQIDIRKSDKAVENFQSALEEPYKNDTYGGKTPEETWGMYLDALKKGDIELASNYYVRDYMISGRVPVDTLYIKKQNGELDGWIKELKSLEKDEQQPLSEDKRYYFYNYFNEEFQQILSSPVVFYFNPYTKVWKIVSL